MRLHAAELSPEHYNRLITTSNPAGESLTMWLTKVTHGDGEVIARGRALGQSRGVVLDPEDVVHLYGDESATAVAAAVGVLHEHRPGIITRAVNGARA